MFTPDRSKNQPEVWATRGKIGRAISAKLVQITLKNLDNFPYQKQ